MSMFQLELEKEVKYAFFFKGERDINPDSEELDSDDRVNILKRLLKKNYILVTKDDELIIKNLGIRKKSITPVTKKIFWEHLVPRIKEEGIVKFPKTFIKNLIIQLLEKDVSLAAMRKDVGNYSQYEQTSPNSIQAQIAKRYGGGLHFLIPNTKGIGVGKGVKLCTIEEFETNNLTIDNIELSNIWKELDYFIKPIVEKNIFDFDGK